MTIYDQLLQFTLFQGMSHADLMDVVTHTRLGFLKMPAGKRLVREGDACRGLIFLISGGLLCETVSDGGSCRVAETLRPPYVVQPERVFGLSQRYTSSFKAAADSHFIVIDKDEVLLLMESQLVFRLNLVNLLATDAQRLSRHAWRTAPRSLRERLTRFFFSRCVYPAGGKTFHILMSQLAQELNDSRLNVSVELNSMQADGLLSLHRGRIEIPLLERLLM